VTAKSTAARATKATAAPATPAAEPNTAAPDTAAVDEQPVPVVRLSRTAPAGPPTPYPGGYAIALANLRVPGGARAHRPGDRVPAGNIERNGWQELVRAPLDGE
jgi:hypothetical protein